MGLARDRDDPARRRFRLPRAQFDMAAFQVHRRPVQPVEFGHADAGERPDGQDRNQVWRAAWSRVRSSSGEKMLTSSLRTFTLDMRSGAVASVSGR